MVVCIPSPLRSYTNKSDRVSVPGFTLYEVLENLDASYPGLRFRIIDEQDRIRTHIKIFINETIADHLSTPLQTTDQVHIICALSGG